MWKILYKLVSFAALDDSKITSFVLNVFRPRVSWIFQRKTFPSRDEKVK